MRAVVKAYIRFIHHMHALLGTKTIETMLCKSDLVFAFGVGRNLLWNCSIFF